MRITVGVENSGRKRAGLSEGAVTAIPRPNAYKLEWFCIYVHWRQGELPFPQCVHVVMLSKLELDNAPASSESEEWQLVTLLPAVEYPVVPKPATERHPRSNLS